MWYFIETKLFSKRKKKTNLNRNKNSLMIDNLKRKIYLYIHNIYCFAQLSYMCFVINVYMYIQYNTYYRKII